jgi:hypothetical protein
MSILKRTHSRMPLAAIIAFVALMTLGCSISVKDHKDGTNSKVDIETPFGGIHVDQDVDVHDTGLPVYPGARIKEKDNQGDEKSANVNISSSFFGVKVVAAEFESDDPPSKIIAYYQDQLKKFGNVVQCHTTKREGDLDIHPGRDDPEASHEVKCTGNNTGDVVELKVGTNDNEHLVSVQPQGKGADFALVYVRTRGKEASI